MLALLAGGQAVRAATSRPADPTPEQIRDYQTRAERGDPDAQNDLGFYFANGRGVAKDLATAVKWYRKASLQGHANAQVNLGICYIRGRAVEKSET